MVQLAGTLSRNTHLHEEWACPMVKCQRNLLFLLAFFLPLLLTATVSHAQWSTVGPDGGDVRSLSYDPHNPDRIFLGTSAGTLFLSTNGGASWSRFTHFGSGDDFVVDHVVIDPTDSSVMYVATWSVNGQTAGGDVFRTSNGGKSWQALPGMHGKSIRALAMSVSNPKLLVAGALDGIFRSTDRGSNWQQISPEHHAEIKNIESIAVDPRNPDVIYAGTWHLPWKTENGGQTWQPIKKGMIDDSDVFSIIVDRDSSSVVYVSACSGIYKSENAGELFHKVQGIPFSARRTRVLHQDPTNPAVVYAGTTEGLWRTQDAGKNWSRISDANIIVNDVLVDPRRPSHVLLATDRSGVLASNSAGTSFEASNQGFAHRQVATMVTDHNDPSTVYAGLVNDKEFGGVFISHDSGAHWQQKSAGLGGRDVFALQETGNGALLAGTNRGIFLLEATDRQWRPINNVVKEISKTRVVRASGKSSKKKTLVSRTFVRSQLNSRVTDIEVFANKWLAATTEGLFISSDHGKTWRGGAVLGEKDFVSVQSQGDLVVGASRSAVVVSTDGGSTWKQAGVPSSVRLVYGVSVAPDSQIWMATREGAYHSDDQGKNWQHAYAGLPANNVTWIANDDSGKRLLATGYGSGQVFESTDLGRSWHEAGNSGYPIHAVAVMRGRLLAATAFDGIVLQPRGEAQNPSRAGNANSGGSRLK
jgi:photosystem II stability/assembly factor-like uncharacterized protein